MAISPTDLAREAAAKGDILRNEFDLFCKQVSELSLPELRERVVVLETEVAGLRKESEASAQLRHANAVLEEKVARLEKVAEEAKQLPVILDRLNKLEEEKREAGKRLWQFIFAAVGLVLGVLGGLVGQLLLSAVRPGGASTK